MSLYCHILIIRVCTLSLKLLLPQHSQSGQRFFSLDGAPEGGNWRVQWQNMLDEANTETQRIYTKLVLGCVKRLSFLLLRNCQNVQKSFQRPHQSGFHSAPNISIKKKYCHPYELTPSQRYAFAGLIQVMCANDILNLSGWSKPTVRISLFHFSCKMKMWALHRKITTE